MALSTLAPAPYRSAAETSALPDAQRRERAAQVALALSNALLGDGDDESDHEADTPAQ